MIRMRPLERFKRGRNVFVLLEQQHTRYTASEAIPLNTTACGEEI
jgi:hypothetical protein